MLKKPGILYALLVIAILILGGGVWLMFNSTADQAAETQAPQWVLPDGTPIVLMDDHQLMQLTPEIRHYLAVYEDGSIYYYEDVIPDTPTLEVIKVWKKGTLPQAELDSLVQFLKENGPSLEGSYQFPTVKEQDKPISEIDQQLVISINCQGVVKTVQGTGYYLAYSSYIGPHRDMPALLNEIYERLNNIASKTTQVLREEVPASPAPTATPQ